MGKAAEATEETEVRPEVLAMTPETTARADGVLAGLTEDDKVVLAYGPTGTALSYIVKKFGNASERAGMAFGLFPLWTGVVQGHVRRSEP